MALPRFKSYIKQDPSYLTPLLSADQKSCLNRLVGEAAFDSSLEHRLVHDRDDTLRQQFQISANTWSHVEAIQANTLEEFCVALDKLQNTMISH